MKIRIVCDSCGGFDYCNADGSYAERHDCELLNTNQLLLRIAVALETLQKEIIKCPSKQ